MKPVADRRGERFGKLVAQEVVKVGRESRWLCRCDCGTTVVVATSNLVTGNTTSCGCSRKKHGMSKTKIYHAWIQMLRRCENENDFSYANYGGRGIKVCDRWHDFSLFYEDMGNPPYGGTLDRIDNDGPYSKANCKWSSWREQHSNKRNNRLMSAFGETKILTVWAEEYGLPLSTLRNRLDRTGMTLEQALTVPAKEKG
jgi:hypothetical protein